jgi:hypothetical protein
VQETNVKWIDFWKRRGLFRADVDAAVASALMCGAYNELAQRMLVSPRRPPIEDWLRHAQGLFVRGLGTPVFVHALERSTRVHPAENGQAAMHRRKAR